MVSYRPPAGGSRANWPEVVDRRARKDTATYKQPKVEKRGKGRKVELKVGNAQRRLTIPMPRTLKMCRNRIKELFPELGKFELWCEPGAMGRRPASVRITTEQAYGTIGDMDVVVLVTEDMISQGDARISTHMADFKAHPFAAAQRRQDDKMNDDSKSVWFGESTYKRDFVRPAGRVFPARRVDGPKKASFAGGSFTGNTTYQDNFIRHEMPDRPVKKTNRDDRDVGKEFKHRSCHMIDFPPHIGVKPVKPLARERTWRPSSESQRDPARSTYQDEFPAHKLPEKTTRTTKTDSGPRAPFGGKSTYQRDFTKKPHRPAMQLVVEPEGITIHRG